MIQVAVKSELQEAMNSYGYEIVKTLVTDIDPDEQVKHAMNRINAAEREKLAAQYEGDAARILIVEKQEPKQNRSVCKDKVLRINVVKLQKVYWNL